MIKIIQLTASDTGATLHVNADFIVGFVAGVYPPAQPSDPGDTVRVSCTQIIMRGAPAPMLVAQDCEEILGLIYRVVH